MNPIQEFMAKARVSGAEHEVAELRESVRVAEAARLKAENDAFELRQALASMQLMKEKYQTVVLDLMAVLERHGLVQ